MFWCCTGREDGARGKDGLLDSKYGGGVEQNRIFIEFLQVE